MWVYVAPGCYAHTTLNHCPQIGDNVTEHIVGHNYVEPFWIFHHPHTNGIHMGIIRFDIFVFLGYFMEGPLPQVEGVRQYIGLTTKRYLLTSLAMAKLKSIADTALHAFTRIHRFLNGNLIRSTLSQKTTTANIETFGILSNHHAIDVFRILIPQRCPDTWIEDDRA